MKHTFRKGGIHPYEGKTANRNIQLLPLPMTAILPLSQHIGAPSEAIVSKGDHVTRGQEIASHPKFVSAGLHAPISGTITDITDVVMANGKPSQAIIIKADESDHAADTIAREQYWQSIVPCDTPRGLCDNLDAEAIRNIIADSGIVGLGGATFPSHVKFAIKPGQEPDILVLNGCECEPYLMCDDALMCTYPARIAEGIELMVKATGAKRAIIGIESNKPAAIAALRKAIRPNSNIEVMELATKYPQGGEKQLVEATTGRRIASGALPLSVGVVVNNVATAFAVWQAIATKQPLIERVVTVNGDIPSGQQCNYMAAIGTPLSELPFTLPEEARVIVGGPMMGRTAVNLDAPITKGTSGLTILKYIKRGDVQPCIRCGECVRACPMGLEPYLLSTYGRLRMWDDARKADVADCLECGACSWSCPSARPLLDYIRIAKQRSR